ncbi:MAG: hypothetical protein K9G76_04785 [Bacteroidales bacterium]|nr:hypothetical protein [Bacteroidales bacterium]MCF8402994.1 hypothetical protein [Bacteroidales bacterium]
MKTLLLFISLYIGVMSFATGQKENNQGNRHPFSVYFEMPFFYTNYWENPYYSILTFNTSYEFPAQNDRKWAISAGVGQEFKTRNLMYPSLVLLIGIDRIYGKKNHFLECGTGIGAVDIQDPGEIFLQLRLGYRLVLAKRILARVGYNPYVYLIPHFGSESYPLISVSNNISVSLGFRFNIGKKVK